MLARGKFLYCQAKILLPTYDVFDEHRNFEPGGHPEVLQVGDTLFKKHGWKSHFAFPCQAERVRTPYGLVDFTDGVQSLLNPRL